MKEIYSRFYNNVFIISYITLIVKVASVANSVILIYFVEKLLETIHIKVGQIALGFSVDGRFVHYKCTSDCHNHA